MIATVPSMIGQFNMNNIRILQDLGYEVHAACNFHDTSVWTVARTKEFLAELKEKRICYHQIDFPRKPSNLKSVFTAYRQLMNLVRDEEYDLIHCHTPTAGVISRLVAHKQKIKIIYTAHGFHFYQGAPFINWIFYYPIEWLCSWWTDVLITINKEDYKRAKNKFKAKKTVYIPGVGVDTEKFAVCKVDKEKKRKELGVKSDDFLLLSVGELSERNNLNVLIDALHNMKKQNSIGNIVYLVAGKGDKESELKELIGEYGLKDHIKLLGFRTDIDELCEIVDCFVYPSIGEGLGIAPLEAMAAELPVIYASDNDIKDFTEDGALECCNNPISVDEMVDAISKMHDDIEYRHQCGQNNRNAVKTYDIRKIDEINEKNLSGGYRHLRSILVRQDKRLELGLNLDDYVIISVGELNDNKNHQVIIRALSKIRDSHLKYIIVGKGVLQDELKHLAESLSVSDRIIITGFRTDIKELLWMADCFAFPSKREGLGIAALEGMAAGLPVIAHDIGGIRDFCEDENVGYICRSNSKDEYVALIKKERQGLINRNAVLLKSRSFDTSITDSIMKDVYKATL